MNRIIIDDDDDNVVDVATDEASQLKIVVKQGLKDLEMITELLDKLSPLMEAFGDSDTIDELRVLYGEIIPNILVGDYEEALEGLSEDDVAIAKLALNQRRKHIISNLLEKYNN